MKRVYGFLALLMLFYALYSPAVLAEEANPDPVTQDSSDDSDTAPVEEDASDDSDPAPADDESSEDSNVADRFTDLKDLPNDVKDKFNQLIESGIFNGISADRFGLDLNMNRAQMAKVASLVFELEVDPELQTSSFSDVLPDGAHAYALPYIEALKAAKLTKGYDAEGTRYNPSGEVSRQELAAFLVRGLGLEDAALEVEQIDDESVAEWALPYVSQIGRASCRERVL